METEKEQIENDHKRVYRSPQLTAFGSVANLTRVNNTGEVPDNPSNPNEIQGTKSPPGQVVS